MNSLLKCGTYFRRWKKQQEVALCALNSVPLPPPQNSLLQYIKYEMKLERKFPAIYSTKYIYYWYARDIWNIVQAAVKPFFSAFLSLPLPTIPDTLTTCVVPTFPEPHLHISRARIASSLLFPPPAEVAMIKVGQRRRRNWKMWIFFTRNVVCALEKEKRKLTKKKK